MSPPTTTSTLQFYLNGQAQDLTRIDPETTVLEYVRKVGLTGTKLVCGEGGCGACTVLVTRKNDDGELVHRPMNACITNICDVHGGHVTTVEGLILEGLALAGGEKEGKNGTDGTDKSGAEKSGAEKPGAEKPGAEKPGAEKSGAEKAGAEKVAAEKSGGSVAGHDHLLKDSSCKHTQQMHMSCLHGCPVKENIDS